jgi:ComF family protein
MGNLSLAHLSRAFSDLGASLLDLCFPGRCAGCGKTWLLTTEGFWCKACLDELPWIRSPICTGCGCPFPGSAPTGDHLCGNCILSAFSFDSARSATNHSGVVRDRIHQLKFGGRLRFGPPLAEILARVFLENGCAADRVDLLMPVPLHVKRLGQRGFNQAGILARMLGETLGLPVWFDALVRKQWTDPQTRLSRQERLENVKGAFAVRNETEVEGKNILLVDDVFTTGTTLSECAKTLKAGGAAAVHAITVTRALPESKGAHGLRPEPE